MYYWSIFPVAPSTANVNLIQFLQKKKKEKKSHFTWLATTWEYFCNKWRHNEQILDI